MLCGRGSPVLGHGPLVVLRTAFRPRPLSRYGEGTGRGSHMIFSTNQRFDPSHLNQMQDRRDSRDRVLGRPLSGYRDRGALTLKRCHGRRQCAA